MIASYFDSQIRPQLLNLIDNAKSEIVAAVAWFTDIKIFNALQQAQMRCVKIQLLTQDDDINQAFQQNINHKLTGHETRNCFFNQYTNDNSHIR